MTPIASAIRVLAASLVAASLAASALGDAAPGAGEDSQLTALLWPARESAGGARIDQSGRVLTPAALHDKVVVLAFVSADCLIACVVRTTELDRLARALPERLRDRTVFLAASVAPGRDDVAALRGFAEVLGIEPARLHLVTGDAFATDALIASLRYSAARLPEPPPTVLVFDRRGRVAMTYGSDPLDGARLLRDVIQLETFEDGIGRPPRAAASP